MDYAAKIEKDKDMGYVVSFPDLPNVNAFGETREEAIKQAKDALDGAMECDLVAIQLSPRIEVAYKIFEARRGKTKAEVAKAAGFTPQAYQRFETPKGTPTVETLYKIAAALGKKLVIKFA